MNEFIRQYAALVNRYVDRDEVDNFNDDFEAVLNAYCHEYTDKYTDDDEDEDEGTDDWADIVKNALAAKQNRLGKDNRRAVSFDEAVKIVCDIIRLVKEA